MEVGFAMMEGDVAKMTKIDKADDFASICHAEMGCGRLPEQAR